MILNETNALTIIQFIYFGYTTSIIILFYWYRGHKSDNNHESQHWLWGTDAIQLVLTITDWTKVNLFYLSNYNITGLYFSMQSLILIW